MELIIPALWRKLMAPKLLEWDEEWASDDERALAMEANLNSGEPALIETAENNYRQLHSSAAFLIIFNIPSKTAVVT